MKIRLYTPRDINHGHWEAPAGEHKVHSLPRVGDLIESHDHDTLLRVLHVVHTIGREDEEDGFPIPFVSVYAVPADKDHAVSALLPMRITSAK